MCLLINAPANTTVSDEWLRDFFVKNDDGFGVMYADKGVLHIRKQLGTPEDFIQMWRETEHLDRAVHLRMRTHGDVDLENCHPYEIFGEESGHPMWLMHNGILATGNAKDVTKSDTWHYIRDYLRPMLDKNPDFAFTEAFAEIIGEHIGTGNKFVIMDAHGRTAVINEDRGVEWEGMWLSNTYAWSATKAGVGYSATAYTGTYGGVYYGGFGGSMSDIDDDFWYAKDSTPTATVSPLSLSRKRRKLDDYDYREMDDAIDYIASLQAERAAGMPTAQYESFVEHFGTVALWELVSLLEEAIVTEVEFVQYLSDFRKYREAFTEDGLSPLAEGDDVVTH